MGKTLSAQAEMEIRQLFAQWARELRPPNSPVMLQPPRIPGGAIGCYKVAVLNDETYPHGFYERTSCNPDVWEEILLFTEGHCPYSEDDPDGVGCDPTGYDPGEGWTETTVEGYTAAWENATATTAPAAPPSGAWIDAGYLDGEGYWHYVWRALDCHWIAYGDVELAIIE